MYEDTVYRMDGFLYALEWLDPKPNPDGTPGKRLTFEESLANALGPPPGRTNSAPKEPDGDGASTTAVPEDTKSEDDESPPPDGKQANPDGAERE